MLGTRVSELGYEGISAGVRELGYEGIRAGVRGN